MVALKSLEYVTSPGGNKRKVQLSVLDFDRLREEMEDLQDALDLEKAKREATGFKKWAQFIKEMKPQKAL